MQTGKFDLQNNEYRIENMRPKRPLINYLWSEQVVCKTDQFGFGSSFAGIGTIRRPLDEGARLVFVKDKDTGVVFSPNRNYGDLPFVRHSARVGLGYHTVESEYDGIACEFGISVPKADNAVLFSVTLKNTGNSPRRLSEYFYLRPQPNLTWHTSYGTGDYNEKIGGLFYPHFGYDLEHDYVCLFLSASERPCAFEVSDSRFLGTYGNICDPQSLHGEKLSSSGITFEDDYCAAMQFDFDLQVGESKTLAFVLGTAKNESECAALSAAYANVSAYENNLREQAHINAAYLDTFTVRTPDAYFDVMANVWLKRQLSLGKTWGRICGKGFRDVMQDIQAFVSFDADLARYRIVYALAHQYADGNPIRMYEPDFTYPYVDGAAWIPATVCAYIKETGDFGILTEETGYLDSEERNSVAEHMRRGLEYLLANLGGHGLTLWRGGDWNDSLNGCGLKGIGESVWLSIAAVKAVKEYAELSRFVSGGLKDAEEFSAQAETLTENILRYGFENGKFIYGYTDSGAKVGSDECEEGKIYLNPQTWAILADILPYDESCKVMDQVERRLKCDFGYVQCAPSYTKGSDDLGRASYFVPGMVENGSVYIHGVTFKIVADCKLGRGENAYDTFMRIRYDNPANANSGVEPYAVSNMYIGPENPYRVGDAPMSWVTGSAGWLYRGMTECIAGVSADYRGLKVKPCLPPCWNEIHAERKFRGKRYDILIKRGEKKGVYVDGVLIEGDVVPLDKGTSVVCII